MSKLKKQLFVQTFYLNTKRFKGEGGQEEQDYGLCELSNIHCFMKLFDLIF